jgi:hypothetical protein
MVLDRSEGSIQCNIAGGKSFEIDGSFFREHAF